ncbi:hypothetical protein ACE1B6_04820 [Aerosakkonemataceae cyanobacterium BLCC-F154]|uniref:Uncharacterized protein n=1 Tax=Floridaenema fluviatile BLCC-F154 TaxID=3153640 RepID=A0ABV4Y6Z6_9CYAN
MNKRINIVKKILEPKKIFALALAAVLLPACANEQETVNLPNAPTNVTTEEVSDNTNQLIGRTVTIRSEPLRKIGTASFTVSDEQFFGSEPILVINASGQPFLLPENDATEIQVTGTVRNFVIADLEREYNLTLDPNLYAEFERKPALIAQSLALAPNPGEVTENPAQFYGKTVAIAGEVENVTGPNTFTLDEEKLVGGEDLLVLHTTPVTAINDGGKVVVTGVVRPFVVTEIERDYDITWDLNVRRELEAKYRNKPVLISTGVYPSAVAQ